MVHEDLQWLSVKKAAAFLGVHPNTIRRWVNEEKLPGTRIGGRGDWRFTREALQHLMRNDPAKGHPANRSLFSAEAHEAQALPSPSPVDVLAHGGEMGSRIQALDWSQTPVGRMEQWPKTLATLVATSLRSRFPIVIWWDRHHYTTFYNDAYIPFLGKTKHPGWLGHSGRECWQEIWPTIGPMLASVFETGRPTWSEDLLLVLDRNLPREEGYFTFSYSAIVGETGTVDGIFCVCTETTERVLSERRLRTLRDLASRASEARSAEEACEIAARLLGTNDADIPFALIYLLDSERTVAHLAALSGLSRRNRAAPGTIALSSSTAVGVWPLVEVAHQGRPALVTGLSAAFGVLAGGPWPESPESALVLPLKAPEQKQVTGFLVVGVSPRRVLDEAYRDFFQLVAGHVATAVANARAYEEQCKRAEALAELDRAKTLFFSNISHEFRTPLTLMLGPLQDLLTERSTLSQAQGEHIELLQRNALRLGRLVNTLLDFSRLEAGRMEAVYEPVDLAALTTDLASNFRSAIEKAGMTLVVTWPPGIPLVYVDQQMWEKIVLNLLSNAFKYTFAGTITVRLEQKETTVEVSVQDTGVGIPAEELPHMFERFHRVKRTQGRTYEGTGIGLSLVYELVKLHAGTIRVTSTPGQGSTFTISLPLGSAHLPAERVAAVRTLPSTAVSASTYVEEAMQLLAGQEAISSDLLADIPFTAEGRQPSPTCTRADKGDQRPAARILFADDNADMRAYISRLLQRHYDVLTAPDGKTALAGVQESPPDLVLADVMMPGIDGFELLHRLRSDAATSHIPVILLSARAGEEAQIEGMAAGADDYLVKPFSARELLARVEARLEIARLRQEAEARVKADIERLKQLEQQKNDFLGVVSHELKTPVTSAKAFAEVLENRFRKAGDEKTAALLGKMNAQMEKLTFLIGDLLDVTRLEAGKLHFQEAFFAFDDLVEDILEEVQRITTHTIQKEGSTSATVYGDRERIGQVLTNLLTNAIKYSPNATTVVVTSSCTQQEVTLCVQDFGIGIAQDKLPHVFERFFRETGAREETFPGLGVGLYVADEIIQRQGGKIWAESEKGHGSTFCFTLPLGSGKNTPRHQELYVDGEETHE